MTMDMLTACLICEGVEDADEETVIAAWQSLIDSGVVWQLQGTYGRTAHRLIEDGICTMPATPATPETEAAQRPAHGD